MITVFRHSSQVLSILKDDKFLDFLAQTEQERLHLFLFLLDFTDQHLAWHGLMVSKSALKKLIRGLEFVHSLISFGPA